MAWIAKANSQELAAKEDKENTVNDPSFDLWDRNVKGVGNLLVLDNLCGAPGTESGESVQFDLADQSFGSERFDS